MKTVSMIEFRKRADAVLQQVRKGHAFVLTYRGTPVARLEPMPRESVNADDPIYGLADVASDVPAPLTNAEIDEIVYGQ